jgi:hypothetical protein
MKKPSLKQDNSIKQKLFFQLATSDYDNLLRGLSGEGCPSEDVQVDQTWISQIRGRNEREPCTYLGCNSFDIPGMEPKLFIVLVFKAGKVC